MVGKAANCWVVTRVETSVGTGASYMATKRAARKAVKVAMN